VILVFVGRKVILEKSVHRVLKVILVSKEFKASKATLEFKVHRVT
jgi:hypothetical protein